MSSSSSSSEDENMLAVVAAVQEYYYTHMCKKPYRPPTVSGATYVNKILHGPGDRCRELFRMDRHVFYKLRDILRGRGLLRNTAGVGIEEQLAMFLFTIGHNQRNRVLQKRFRHSGETISRHFNGVLDAIVDLRTEFIQLPDLGTPLQVKEDGLLYPYFKDCIGAVDGTHIPVMVGTEDQPQFRNLKGFTSQNVMAACSFDLQFLYVVAGWEGSASDSRILKWALDSGGFTVPEGKYYLVDSDYPNMSGFIAPYEETNYPIYEFGGVRLPHNAKELFNHRHSLLRSSIDRAFTILKERFPVLKMAPPYPFPSQVKLVTACCIIHNHIRREHRNDWLFAMYERGSVDMGEVRNGGVFEDVGIDAGSILRDSIAEQMWSDLLGE